MFPPGHSSYEKIIGQFSIAIFTPRSPAYATSGGQISRKRHAQLAHTVLSNEMELHRGYVAEWGISATELANEQPTPTSRAYSDYLLRTASLGDYADLVAALLPCMWGYHELALRLAEHGSPRDERYARWIAAYASREFGALADWCRELADAAARAGDQTRMHDAFLTSSRDELAFWDASWHQEATQ